MTLLRFLPWATWKPSSAISVSSILSLVFGQDTLAVPLNIMFMVLFMMDRFCEAGPGGCLCRLRCGVFLHALEGSRKYEGEHSSKLLLVPSIILQVDLLSKVFSYFGEKDYGDLRLHFL